MRTLLLALAITFAPLAAAELKVDHATVAGRNLAELRRVFESAGLATEYGGKHSNGVTEMALASFPDGSYLELIAPQPQVNADSHYWGKYMTEQAGPCGWAITTTDMPGDLKRFGAAGIAAHPQKSGRKRPEGMELKWETATVGPEPQGSFFPFLIYDETPRERRVYPQGKPTTTAISGVLFVAVAVRDLPSAIEKYRAAFGLGEPRMAKDAVLGARLASFPGTPIVLATPSGPDTWLAQRLKQFGEIPCAFVLEAAPGGNFKTAEHSRWFSRDVGWLELGGMRIAVAQ